MLDDWRTYFEDETRTARLTALIWACRRALDDDACPHRAEIIKILRELREADGRRG